MPVRELLSNVSSLFGPLAVRLSGPRPTNRRFLFSLGLGGFSARAWAVRQREFRSDFGSVLGPAALHNKLQQYAAKKPVAQGATTESFSEPPAADSSLWTLPNVVMSPHIGGTIGDEVGRLADCVIEEFEAWRDGRPLRYQVTREILATMG